VSEMGKLHFVWSPDFGSDTRKRHSAGNVSSVIRRQVLSRFSRRFAC
jgi:hypothetical protein